jgi:hypothetical protein
MPGDGGFDPLEFSSYFDMNKMRENELAHGRAAMLATVGLIFPAVFGKLPGLEGVSANPILALSQCPPESLAAVGLSVFACECARSGKIYKDDYPGCGELDFDPLEFTRGKSADEIFEMRTKEVKNGRLAMVSFIIMMEQLGRTGDVWPFNIPTV